jgi:outer membrane receptor protein involved in Fe transport
MSVTQISGGNPDLKPEQSRSLSLGLILAPRFIPNLRASIDFVSIRKSDEINTLPGGIGGFIQREQDFPGRIIRGPNQPGDLPGWAGPITQIDLTLLNLSSTRVRAWDLSLDYELATLGLGTFRPHMTATYQPTLSRQALPGDDLLNLVGYESGPLKYKASIGVEWQIKKFTAEWTMQYFGRHRVCLATDIPSVCDSKVQRQGSTHIRSQVYHDLFLSYDIGRGAAGNKGTLSGLRIALAIHNLFDKPPPIVASPNFVGYDYNGDPRMRRFLLTVGKSFGGR